MLRRFLVFPLILAFATSVWAADTTSIPSNTLKVGRKIAATKTIEFENNAGSANPKLRFNNTSSKLELANDGTTFLQVAAGSALDLTGAVLTMAGPCPTGTLAGDGSAVSRTTYANLFTKLGITHGQGDGSTTFNLPDYRGRFLRGVDGSAGNDPDKASRTAMATGGNTGNSVGSVQSYQLQSHGHSLTGSSSTSNKVLISGAATNNGTSAGPDGYLTWAAVVSNGYLSINNTGGNETRPLNAYVNYCIVY